MACSQWPFFFWENNLCKSAHLYPPVLQGRLGTAASLLLAEGTGGQRADNLPQAFQSCSISVIRFCSCLGGRTLPPAHHCPPELMNFKTFVCWFRWLLAFEKLSLSLLHRGGDLAQFFLPLKPLLPRERCLVCQLFSRQGQFSHWCDQNRKQWTHRRFCPSLPRPPPASLTQVIVRQSHQPR